MSDSNAPTPIGRPAPRRSESTREMPRLKEVAFAIQHPTRRRLLALLDGPPLTRAELAKQLRVPGDAIKWHLDMLRTLGCVELVEARQCSGVIRHYLRATIRLVIQVEPGRLTVTVVALHGYQWDGLPE